MKNFTKFILGAILITVSVSSTFAQTKLFENIKVTPRWVTEPEIQSGSSVTRGTSASLRWLQLDVDYTAIKPKGLKSGSTAWLDSVVIKYDVLLPVESTNNKPVVLSGTVEYWSIPMDGEEHHAQAFIHPKILQRYAPELKMRKTEIQDIKILVTITVNQSPVGMGVYRPKASVKETTIMAEVKKALDSMNTFKGNDLVFGRNKTPWGVLNPNYYELIKETK